MKLKIKRTLMVILVSAVATASAWDASENSVWLDGSIKGKLSNKLSLKLTEQLRYKSKRYDLSYRYTDIEASYAFTTAWRLVPALRRIESRKNSKADWQEMNMYHINLNNKVTVLILDLKSRLRFTYTDTVDLADFRPEFTLTPNKGFTEWHFRPYIADELMYCFNEGHLYKNRVSTGILLSPLKSLSLKLFIMQEITERTANSKWTEAYNMGMYAGYSF